MKLSAAIAALLALAAPLPAAAYCYEPSEPFCINGFGTFDDEWSFRNCRTEIESYVRDMDSYVDCVVRDANDKTSGIVEYFNCKASGQSFCFKSF